MRTFGSRSETGVKGEMRNCALRLCWDSDCVEPDRLVLPEAHQGDNGSASSMCCCE